MAPLRQANWPGLHRSSVGQRQEALSTQTTRHTGLGAPGAQEARRAGAGGAARARSSHLQAGGSVIGRNLSL